MGFGNRRGDKSRRPRGAGDAGCTRRDVLRAGGAGLGALALGGLSAGGLPLGGCGGGGGGEGDAFRFAVLADTHLIDSFYSGPEGSPEDTESIFHTRERLEAARAVIHGIRPAVEQVFICGDVIHNYPSTEWDFYFENQTRWDVAAEVLGGFDMPVHIGLGNHDYDLGDLPRSFTHDLFRDKLGLQSPYYAVEHRGVAFLHVNNFLGPTGDRDSAAFNPDLGSLGPQQLDWLEAELQRGRPTFVFLHFPLSMMERREDGDRDLITVLRDHGDSVLRVISGHWHIWMDHEDSYGTPHLLCASTRYDADAFLVVEADPRAGTHRVLNWERLQWYSHETDPWAEAA